VADKKTASGAAPEGASARELIVLMRDGQRTASMAAATGGIGALLSGANATIAPLFEEDEGIAMSPDLRSEDSVYFHVSAADSKLDALRDQLELEPAVEAAYIKPAAELPAMANEALLERGQDTEDAINEMLPSEAEPPATTPNFTARQIYLNPAPAGVDANYAWRFPGGRGRNINVIDLEWGWRFSHEDLRQNQGGIVEGTGSTNTAFVNHGTAVIGEIGADWNSFGVTGIAPDAVVSAVAFSMPTATAIRKAADRLSPGDVMLLEIHRAGPRFNFQARGDQRGYIAIEWWPDDYAAIRYATGKGIIVVEAAGNGAENFDDALYDQRPAGFPVSWRNPLNPANTSSRAVVVGAGAPPPGTHGRDHGPDRSRLGFSNYGRRVDAQGWGREVTTTGYGDLQSGSQDRWYTDTFSGTSSASPIVTGVLACVNGALKANGQSLLTPQGAINLLRSTGSPQTDAPSRPRSQRIGNRPNLKQMLDRVVKARNRFTGVWRAGKDRHYLWVNASWSNFVAKWQQLGSQNLRLTDFEISKAGNTYLYSGIWREGSDPYYLWVNATWQSFVSKWQQLASQNLRLIDIEIKQIGNSLRYSGVWRGGNDPYYLWVNATWQSFVSKWQQLSARNMRLVDIEIRKIGNDYRYTGVWRYGKGAHYLWVNATWSSFIAKWQQLAGQNLRLTKIVRTNINGQWRYSGIWGPGSDQYYLWVNASWPSFVDKWQTLSAQGLRLVDFEVALEGDPAPSAPSLRGSDMLSMILEGEAGGDGFGGGDMDTDGLSVAGIDSGAATPMGKGGGDLGQGFQVASIDQGALADIGAAEENDGYGGGVLPNEGAETQIASLAASAAGDLGSETEDGTGFGGGGFGEVTADAGTTYGALENDGEGFGGGSVT